MKGENHIIRYLPVKLHYISSDIPFVFYTLRMVGQKSASNKRTHDGHN
jgi:hypothetical protein